ncbi:hypothetical protein KAR91_11305 [Candidatus Pacearchaeota archaeon]|nr:hypothetical protein [Candidatus Pacearchaeota archaeon]
MAYPEPDAIIKYKKGIKYEFSDIPIDSDDTINIDLGHHFLDRVSAVGNLTAGNLMRLYTAAEVNGNYVYGTAIGFSSDLFRTYNGISQPNFIPTTNKIQIRITTDGVTTGDLTIVFTYLGDD